ncbi:MAG: DUF2169 domain-containing protein [Nitrospirae bacterium]|nr:DUF2169 domain-containing protein [Nitrospirota bacterium]
MKTIKPQKLGILTRVFEFKRRFYLAASVLMYIPLTDKAELYSETGMWKFAAAELGKDAALDACIPKANPEYLVIGSAFVPGGVPNTGCIVSARLGMKEKILDVIGDRYWISTLPGNPALFSSMPLDWAHAFGGEGFAKNPLGKGFKPVTVNNVKVHWLPNIQLASQGIISPDQTPEPAGLGPIDFSWPQRFTKAGTHDDNWLKEDFPGFARDIDWTIFNTTSPDQWFDGPLKGDESYQFQNMHPIRPVISGNLPGFDARCFVSRKTESGELFDEIKTPLKTVWFFPHAERAILIYQGSIEVFDEDAADVSHIVIGAEHLGEPKSPDHYREVMRLRLDKEKGPLYSLKDADLLPDGVSSTDAAIDDDKAMFEGEGLIRKNLGKRAVREIEKARAVVAGYGLDPDLHGPKLPPPDEPLPDLEHLPEFMEKIFAQAEEQKRLAEEGKIKSLKETEELFNKMGMDFNVIREEIAHGPKGPPEFSAQAQIDSLKELVQRLRGQGIAADEVEGYLADEGFCNRLYEGERKLKEVYRFTAHHQEAALSMPDEKALSVRDAVQAAYASGASFSGLDLTGADLSGLELAGVNFEDAFLESVNFSNANLEGGNFKNAVIAHAVLNGARLANAVFESANLGKTSFINADASVANLTGAVLAGTDFTGVKARGALMQGADFSGSTFHNTDFSEVQAAQITFLETDLCGLTLKGAMLDNCTFLKVNVNGVDFEGASLKSSVFLESSGKMTLFKGADMTNVRFVSQCNFEKADFSGACLNNANLRGSNLDGCNFTSASLNGADLSECKLKGSRLFRSVAKDTRFIKADLSGAEMTSINAMKASFQRADICGSNLKGANLYQADLARVHANPETNLGEALTKKARIYPLRKP